MDSASVGKRERDRRNKIKVELQTASVQQSSTGQGRKPGFFQNRDPALNWDDIAWFQQATTMKIVLKVLFLVLAYGGLVCAWAVGKKRRGWSCAPSSI